MPRDRKSGIFLRGRSQEQEIAVQMRVPLKIIQELLDTVFVVRDYVVLAETGVAIVAFGIMALVFCIIYPSPQTGDRNHSKDWRRQTAFC